MNYMNNSDALKAYCNIKIKVQLSSPFKKIPLEKYNFMCLDSFE